MSDWKIIKILEDRAGSFRIMAHNATLAGERSIARIYTEMANLLKEVAEALKAEVREDG